MTRRLSLTAFALIFATSLTSCILNPSKETPKEEKPPAVEYKDLTEDWHVLHNLEAAYNDADGNFAEYTAIFDKALYTFHFAEDGELPWNYETEAEATRKMFSGAPSNQPEVYGAVTDITLDLQFENVQPSQVIEPGYENEIWHEFVVNYYYEILIEPDWRILNGDDAKASFIVRQVFDPVDGRQEWRLVRWRDLGFGQ